MLEEISITPKKEEKFLKPQWTWVNTPLYSEHWEMVHDIKGNPIMWCNENIQSIKELCHAQIGGYWGISGCSQKEIGNAEIDNC
tara:strand:+ start:412 stop:663 length:252 start_codon:yes stop_codon:yes gene_type:complete